MKQFYSPVLKTKVGELRALRNVRNKPKLMPILEFIKSKNKDNLFTNINKGIYNLNAYVDISLDNNLTFDEVFARIGGNTIVPVVNLETYRNHGLENIPRLAVRITVNDIINHELLQKINLLLEHFKKTPEECDIIIDMKYLNDDNKNTIAYVITNHINSLKNYYTAFNNVIITGTSFPADLSNISKDSIGFIDRIEKPLWHSIISNTKIDLIFGDYGIQNPILLEYSKDKILTPSANIRYTKSDQWAIVKGTRYQDNPNQFHDLASTLIQQDFCKESDYSAGDMYIHRCASRINRPGNLTTWREVGMNHHFEFVLEELSNYYDS
jgi:hypothetical protein